MNARMTAQPVGFNNEGGRIAIQAAEYRVYGNNIVNQVQDSELEKLPYAAEAPFNAYTKQYEPTCLPSTRTALLNEIYSWTDGQDEPCVYWLNGLAGTGKSTIARTVARRHYGRKSLGASFFFTKGGGDVSHVGKFATSIAVQLAHNIPASRQHICKAIAERPDITRHSLRDQWQHLVLNPLSALDNPGNINALVVVIDALDECDDDNDIRVVIGLLAEAQELSRPRLRILLTSRPEVAIRHGFYHVPDALHRSFVLHHIASSIVDADIELFLEHSLTITGREQRLRAGWPGPETIAMMVQRASGLFIWAATAHRFIQQGRRFATRRLESILKSDSNTHGESEKHLDNIYITVLQNSLRPEYTSEEKEEHCKMLRHILGSLVVLKSPLTAQSLGELLDVAEEDIVSVVEDMHAILDVPADATRPLRLHHPSLRDFLLDKSRCTDDDFWVDKAQVHSVLASGCIALMTCVLEQNEEKNKGLISKRDEDFLPERYAELMLGMVHDEAQKGFYPPELKYACYNWAHHLQRSATKPVDDGQAHTFLKKYGLDWAYTPEQMYPAKSVYLTTDHTLYRQYAATSVHSSTYQTLGQINSSFLWLDQIDCLRKCVSKDDSPQFYAVLQEFTLRYRLKVNNMYFKFMEQLKDDIDG